MKSELERYKEVMRIALTAMQHVSVNLTIADALNNINFVLNPPQATEEVEESLLLCPKCRKVEEFNGETWECDCGECGTLMVKLTGKITRPVPQKVEYQWMADDVELRALRDGFICECSSGGLPTGKTGTLTFTWTE